MRSLEMAPIRSAMALGLLQGSLMLHKLIFAYMLIVTQFLLVSSSDNTIFVDQVFQPVNIDAQINQLADFSSPPLLVQPKSEAEILLDTEGKISKDFQIPPVLIPRVGFWFDIYSKYSSQHRVIHHQDYPWWVLEVVDTTDILSAPANAQWLNVEKAQKTAQGKLNQARLSFQKIAKKIRRAQTLTDDERILFDKLELLPGGASANLKFVSSRLRLQTGQKDFFIEGLKKSTRYLEYMEKIFIARGLPTELTRLPLVESSFNIEAGSKVGALGIWQLMPAVSKKFILVSDQIDERKSPYKATMVAARMFNENYKLLSGSWPLVVTAYNHGPGSLRKAVRELGTDDIGVIIKKYKAGSFGFASENFYSEFLAALIVQKYSQELFGDLISHEFSHVEQLTLPRKIKIQKFIKLSQLSSEEFISYNPDLKKALRQNSSLPKGFAVFIPSTQMPVVLEGLEISVKVAQK